MEARNQWRRMPTQSQVSASVSGAMAANLGDTASHASSDSQSRGESIMPRLRVEHWFVSYAGHAFVKAQTVIYLHPPSRVAHVGQVEGVVSQIPQPREADIERRRYSIGGRAAILRAKVEISTMPFRVDVHDIVEPGVLGWRLDVLGLQLLVNKFFCLCLDDRLHGIRRLWVSWRSVSPGPISLRHLLCLPAGWDGNP